MKSSQKITLLAIIISINVSASFIIKIPTPSGFVSTIEVGIFLAALLGSKYGFISGALSGLLVDLISGYPQWIIFSTIIHGVEGWLLGTLNYSKIKLKQIVMIIFIGLFMVSMYFLSGMVVMLLFTPKSYTLWSAIGVAAVSIPTNIIQYLLGVVSLLIFRKNSNITKFMER